MARWHRSPEALEAAQAWRDRCWMADGSILSEHALWTSDNLAYLDRHFVQNPDESDRNFLEKLHDQLEPTPPAVKQLAAEILWILYLSVSDTAMKGATKRVQIRQVWEWSGELAPSSAMLDKPLDTGFAHPGTGFATNRWREFAFCVLLARDWKAEPWSLRKRWMSDPWEFATWVDKHPAGTTRQFRHMLLYLLFPDHFERVMTSSHKEQILRRLGPRFGLPMESINLRDRTDVDRRLHELRPRLEAHYQSEVADYYEVPIRSDWMDAPETGRTDPALPLPQAREWHQAALEGRRVWLLAPGDGARLWPEFQRDGVAAIGWDDLAQLGELLAYQAVYEALRGLYGGNPTNDANTCWQFAHQVQPEDVVIAKQGRSVLLGWGIVRSAYRYDEGRAEFRHVRDVQWRRSGRWTLPPEHRMVVKTLTDMTPFPQWLHAAFRAMEGEAADAYLPTRATTREDADALVPPPQPLTSAGPMNGRTVTERESSLAPPPGSASPAGPVPGGRPARPPEAYSIEQALDELFMSQEQFTGILDALARKKNVILEGAPGVGKTFVARRIAWALLNERDDARVQMVQFHQSYAYEDFVQGWRPQKEGFVLQDGVFHRFCRTAAADPGRGYVFIIDEINRGNLSKIFGELMMLIEHDKRGPDYALSLAYSPGESFHVPENLYLLGMMNTADRSLAMVDYALRRRFGFIRLRPAFEVDQFANHLAELGASDALVQRIVIRMAELNQAIAQDPRMGVGYEVGHSFFVPGDRGGALDDAWYERVVRQEIEPLLHEYWFGREEQAREHVERLLA